MFNIIDTTVFTNFGTYLLAKMGDQTANFNMAIKYAIDGNIKKSSLYLQNVENTDFFKTHEYLYKYYLHCSYYNDHSNIGLFYNRFDEGKYELNWPLTKRAIIDKFFTRTDIVYALNQSIVNDTHVDDFIEYTLKNIRSTSNLFYIFKNRTNIINKMVNFGFCQGYLHVTKLVDLAYYHEEFAKAVIYLLSTNNNIFKLKSSQTKLSKLISNIAGRHPCVKYQCGILCLQLGNLNKAYKLLSNIEKNDPNYAKAMKECGDMIYTNGEDCALAVIYYQKAYTAGENDAKLMLHATLNKAKGQSPSIVDLYCETAHIDNNDNNLVRISNNLFPVEKAKSLFSQRLPSSYTITYKSLKEAHQYYLSHKGFFSRQSRATQKVIDKASKPYITDQRRFQILKKYVDKKSNIYRDFWSTLVVFFGNKFMVEISSTNLKSTELESRSKIVK